MRKISFFTIVIALALAAFTFGSLAAIQDNKRDQHKEHGQTKEQSKDKEHGQHKEHSQGKMGDQHKEHGGHTLTAMLTGAAEVPGPGDPDGTGTATFRFNPGQGQVCFELQVSNIQTATAAHIHAGTADKAGPVVVGLTPLAGDKSSGCVSLAREKMDEIIKNPADFYVNVHNAEFKAGAVRGQLTHGMSSMEQGGQPLTVMLTGAAEVPGPGDPDGTGTATLRFNPGQNQLCFELQVSNIQTATAAHIHAGTADKAGPVVVGLTPLAGDKSSGCVTLAREKIDEILKNPSNFYVNVHNAEFKAGAVRGQLSK